MTTPKDTLKAIQESMRGKTAPNAESVPGVNQKIKKTEEMNPKKEDRRKYNGGLPGVGRKAGGVAQERRIQKDLLSKFFAETVKIRATDPKTGKEVIIDKPRTLIVAERLFGFTKDTPQAVDMYLNRVVGKPPQPVVGDEDEPPVQIDIGVDRMLDKVYGKDDDDE